MGEAAKSHSKRGVENYDHILNQSTTVFVVGSGEECQSLSVRTGGGRGAVVRKSQFSIRNAGGKFSWHEINRKA